MKTKVRQLFWLVPLLGMTGFLFWYPIVLAILLFLLAITIGVIGLPARGAKLVFLLLAVALLGIAWSAYEFAIARATLLVLIVAIVVAIASSRWKRKRYLTDLNSDEESIRIRAAFALASDIATVDDLAAAFARERSARVRKAIIETLHAMSRQYLKKDEMQKAQLSRYEGQHPLPMTLDLPSYPIMLKEYFVPLLIEAMQSSDREEREAALLHLLWIGTEDAVRAIGSSLNSATRPPALSSSPENAQFTAYYPHLTKPEQDNSLFVYAYVQGTLSQVHQDVIEAGATFGGHTPASTTAKQRLSLPKGTPLTIIPECEHVTFEPSAIMEKWNGEWMQFRFAYRPKTPVSIDELLIRVSIRIHSIEIAHINCLTKVMAESNDSAELRRVVNFGSQSSVPYQSIFISYSRKDMGVVSMYRQVQKALGNDVFVDTYSIRAGANWREDLENAIDTTDIFQLFWSENSAKSSAVRDEWKHALSHRYPKTRCVGFIRPVYWVLPIPAKPPDELAHLNFKYVPLLAGLQFRSGAKQRRNASSQV